MNNINFLITFENPLLLLLAVPAILISLYYFFKLPKSRRVNRNRIVSMALHIAVIVLVTLVFAEVKINETFISEKNDVIVLIDSSASNSHNTEEVNNFLQDIINESEDKHKIGIVNFANENIYSVPMTSNKKSIYDDYLKSNHKPDVSATNISTALLYAASLLETPIDGRIILMTDGLDTEGNVVNIAKSIASTGTRIDTVFFSPVTNDAEIKVENITFDGTVGIDKTANINVNIKSNRSSTAKVTLYDNDEKIHEQTLIVENGDTTITVPQTYSEAKLHVYRAVIECNTDTINQNNESFAFVNIEHFNKVLLVDGTGYDANHLNSLINNDYALEYVTINNTPTTIQELIEYEEVILVNVSPLQLESTGFDTLLDQYVYDYGGGMLVVSGENTFIDEIQDTLYEDMLPVQLNDEPNPLSLMVVVDASGSMGVNKVPNSSKYYIDVAREGLIECANVLKPSDYMGIIAFDASPRLALPLTPSTQTTKIYSAIDTVVAGHGTAYTAAINTAAEQLAYASSDSLKHIMFITDGAPQDEGYIEAIEGLDSDITLSVIVVGESWEVNMDACEQMVEAGDGRLYQSVNGTDLSAIMKEDTEVTLNEKVNYENVEISIEDYSSSTVLGLSGLPNLSGYYGGVQSKRTANTVLAYKGNPIYSDWSYGNGRVGALMTDVNNEFSSEFMSDMNGQQFIKNVVQSLIPAVSTSAVGIKVDFTTVNNLTSLGITSNASSYTIEAKLTSPSGIQTSLNLEQQTQSYFGSNYTMTEPGLYTLEVTKVDSKGNVVAKVTEYQVFSYSAEYTGFYNESICYNLTRDIAVNAGGNLMTEVTGMFDLDSQTLTNIYDLRIILMSCAVIFFLADIAARKFKFKLPGDSKRELRK